MVNSEFEVDIPHAPSACLASVNAACLRSCLAIEGKEKGRNHANSGTGSIRVGSMGQRDRSVRRAEPHAGATATADAAR